MNQLKISSVSFLAVPAFVGFLTSCAPAQPAMRADVPAKSNWKMAPVSLSTKWAKQVSPANALPEYPRPQMTRGNWKNLNGLWNYGLSDLTATAAPSAMNEQILVPYVYESALSGVGKASVPEKKLWYKRSFTVPADWKGQRVLLHFGAVNYNATVMLNGQMLGAHRGGFDGFSFDITSALRPGQNELVVSSQNPLRSDVADAQVAGKQRIKPGGIFYTGATGIWQTVWMEPVPAARIDSLKITPDIDAGQLRVTALSAGNAPLNAPVTVTVSDGGRVVATKTGSANTDIVLPIANAKLWTPENPHLYGIKVSLGNGRGADSVNSYAAMRKTSLVKDDKGRLVLGLNNKPYFQVGALDQGYWPDGIFTAPTDAALKYDIVEAKKLGWNLLRKHAKVEPARWYYHCDQLGMLVWQDMPQMYGGQNGALSDDAKKQFGVEWGEIIRENYNYPSIVVWTTFNEAWGQHDTPEVVAQTRKWDPTRLVNNASGWTDKNVGDMHDFHAYPGPDAPMAGTILGTDRASVNGEFGGITADLGHRWQNSASVMGYGATLKSGWLATKRFQDLMKTAYRLKDERGASAFVYTQITDVEQEINGILTYDREVVKLDPKIVAAANRGQWLPLLPNPNPDVVPTSDLDPLPWKYSFEQPAANWFETSFDDANWKTGNAPFGKGIGNVKTNWDTSDIWMRRQFTLDGPLPANAKLSVLHDEDAEIYINGVLAAKISGYNGGYEEFPISEAARATMKPGVNVWAVHVRQTAGGQGIDVGIGPVK